MSDAAHYTVDQEAIQKALVAAGVPLGYSDGWVRDAIIAFLESLIESRPREWLGYHDQLSYLLAKVREAEIG